MPAPTTNDDFLELIRKSGVTDPGRLQAHVERLTNAGQLPADPPQLANQLIRDGVITHFQAEQFLQGKWRRFTIGKYKVLEKLGAGGMGSVYLCEHLLMRRRVAVKVLPEAKSNDSSSLDRFYREARAVAALDHPNIVRAYDIDQDEKLHFLVMEHVDGSSLQEIIKKVGPMDVLRATHYMRQAALGLQHAHETAALVHRDIKPGNVLVDRNGIVKVLDMGLARFFLDDTDDLTKKYDENVLGTADYLAPEQALDSHGADIRADVYSLGGTFYFCLTGRTPFAEGTVAQKLIWHQTRNPKPIRSIRPEVPEEIAAIIDKMMAKDKNARYQTPQEVADALAPFTQVPIPPPPENEMPQFSLAARIGGPETGMSSSQRRAAAEKPPSPAPRKNWQVANAPTPSSGETQPPNARATVAPATPAPAATPTSPRPVARPTGSHSQAPIARPSKPATAVDSNRIARAPAARPAPVRPLEITQEHVVDEEKEPEVAVRTAPQRPWALVTRTFEAQPPLVRWLLLALVLLVPLTSLLLYLLMGSSGKPNRTGGREPIRFVPGANTYLSQVINKARDGDRIILTGDITNECNIRINQRDLILEGEAGKKITWKCPPKQQAGTKLLILSGSSAGFQLKNLTLDGNQETESLVVMFGKCPGIKLDQVEMQNSKRYDLLITNCEGSADQPVQFVDLVFRSTRADQTAVHFTMKSNLLELAKLNRFFSFKNCVFEGPAKKVTSNDPATVDADTVELPAGVSLERVK